jgi:drug/metabolite transporter (DMT)-like permease
MLLAAAGQIFLKKGAVGGLSGSFLRSIFHPFAFIGYILMFGSMLFTMAALTALPLKLSVEVMPVQYFLVALLSFIFFNEKLDLSMIFGSIIILAGIAVFNL